MKFLADFFPILLFFVFYKLYDIYAATAVAIAASFVQVGFHWFRHRKFETMHVVTLGILVVFGGLTIALQDRAFIMWKPSVVNWLFAVVFLFSQFIGKKPLIERMMSHAITVPGNIWKRLNSLWVVFFLFMGALNLYIASDFFVAEEALRVATSMENVDLAQCAELFQDRNLELCANAQSLEESWVNFKLFGMLGLTVVFVIAQAFYLARHIQDEPETEKN